MPLGPRLAAAVLLLAACPADDAPPSGSGTSDAATTSDPTSVDEGPATESADDGSTGAAAVCGNGMIEAGEECDDGEANSDTAACTRACLAAACGDGLVHAGVEVCDDGNEWTQTFDGTAHEDEEIHGIAVDPAGNVLVAGHVTTAAAQRDVRVRKLGPDGTELWTRTAAGNGGQDDEGRGNHGQGTPVPSLDDYADALRREVPSLFEPDVQLVTELGRALQVGCGFAVSRVEYTKQVDGRRLATVHVGADLLVRTAYRTGHRPVLGRGHPRPEGLRTRA